MSFIYVYFDRPCRLSLIVTAATAWWGKGLRWSYDQLSYWICQLFAATRILCNMAKIGFAFLKSGGSTYSTLRRKEKQLRVVKAVRKLAIVLPLTRLLPASCVLNALSTLRHRHAEHSIGENRDAPKVVYKSMGQDAGFAGLLSGRYEPAWYSKPKGYRLACQHWPLLKHQAILEPPKRTLALQKKSWCIEHCVTIFVRW